jgi:L-iditol 2-dehydrogenase
MQALVYNGPWDVTLEQLPDPVAGPGEALLRVDAVGICGSDVHGFTGESGRRTPGMVMGHEVSATVVELGDGVDSLAVDDRVTIYNIDYCGTCVHCRVGKQQLCESRRILGVNAGTWGAMAPYVACPVKCLFPFDKNADPAIALLAEPIGIATHAVNIANVQPDNRVSIVGGGTIGLALTIVLRDRGVAAVHVLDRVPEKLAMIESFGGKGVNIDETDPMKIAADADVAFEAVGAGKTAHTAFDLTRPGGMLVLLGNLAQQLTLPLQRVVQQETIIRGSYGFTPQDFGDAVDLVMRKRDDLTGLITGSCTLEQAPQVMTELARGERQAIKMVIRF